jgi:AbrB family looped-hinge helix DNA binding protein
MTTVAVSPKFQVVIPKIIREELNIQPGQKMQVIADENHILLIPIRPITEVRGFLQGIDTTIEREKDRL